MFRERHCTGIRVYNETGCSVAVYNHWTGLVTGLVDWTGGLDWWTDTKINFMLLMKLTCPIGCMMHHINPKQPSSCTGLI